MPYLYTSDAYSPQEIAKRVEKTGVIKAQAHYLQTFMLGVMAGGFIAMGGLFYTIIAADPSLNPTAGRLLGGVVFATGYIITLLAGAEVFTSNNLLAMTFASRRITLRQLLKNWGIVLLANAVGAFGMAALFVMSGLHRMEDGAVGTLAYQLGLAKTELTMLESFSRAVLGNLFVCIAVWISLGGRSIADKVLGVLLPLTALSALSLEHIVVSLYYVPRALLLAAFYPEYAQNEPMEMTVAFLWRHIIPVIIGNIIGGSVMVASVYYIIYLRLSPPSSNTTPELTSKD